MVLSGCAPLIPRDGRSEVILFVARQVDNRLKWHGWMEVKGGFSGARFGGLQPYTNEALAFSLFLPNGYIVTPQTDSQVAIFAQGEGHPGGAWIAVDASRLILDTPSTSGIIHPFQSESTGAETSRQTASQRAAGWCEAAGRSAKSPPPAHTGPVAPAGSGDARVSHGVREPGMPVIAA